MWPSAPPSSYSWWAYASLMWMSLSFPGQGPFLSVFICPWCLTLGFAQNRCFINTYWVMDDPLWLWPILYYKPQEDIFIEQGFYKEKGVFKAFPNFSVFLYTPQSCSGSVLEGTKKHFPGDTEEKMVASYWFKGYIKNILLPLFPWCFMSLRLFHLSIMPPKVI